MNHLHSQHIRLHQAELDALAELPLLQRCLYVFALKPYMDNATGMVGIKRGVSWQSIAENLYIRPQRGIKVDRFSKQQIRRAAKQLEKIGLIDCISERYRLVFKLPLALVPQFVQNKADTKPTDLADTPHRCKHSVADSCGDLADTDCVAKGGTPLISINNIVIDREQKIWFAKFWQAYPIKKSQERTKQVFANLVRTESLLNVMLCAIDAQKQERRQLQEAGKFVPAWKYPATWLLEGCWEDEVALGEENHRGDNKAKPRKGTRHTSPMFPINRDFSDVDYDAGT